MGGGGEGIGDCGFFGFDWVEGDGCEVGGAVRIDAVWVGAAQPLTGWKRMSSFNRRFSEQPNYCSGKVAEWLRRHVQVVLGFIPRVFESRLSQ